MVFFYLISTIFSLKGSLSLTDGNYSENLRLANGTPILVEIWDKHYYESKSYKETWKTIATLEEYKGKIIFADLNCHYESLTCQKIGPGRVYPRFVWINTKTGETRQYTGGQTFDEIQNWIRMQLSPPIEPLETPGQFSELLPTSVKMSLFKFTISKSDEKSIEIAQNAALQVHHLQIKIVMELKDDVKPSLSLYTPDNREVAFNEEFTIDNLVKFFKIHAIRFFAPYSDRVNHFSMVEQMPVMVFLYDHTKDLFRNRAIETAKQVEHLLPTVQTGCNYSNFFCRYVDVYNDKLGVAVIIDKYRNLFWVSNLDKNVLNWTKDVLEGKVRGSGPGTGVLKEYLMLFYDMRAKGGWPYYCLFLPFGVMIFGVLILMLFIACIVNPEPVSNPYEYKPKIE